MSMGCLDYEPFIFQVAFPSFWLVEWHSIMYVLVATHLFLFVNHLKIDQLYGLLSRRGYLFHKPLKLRAYSLTVLTH